MKPDQLSKTAAYVAIKFYGLTLIKPYCSLFDKETLRFYDRLVANLPSPLNKYHSYLKNRWIRDFTKSINEILLPGDLMHILMRKYYVSKMISELSDQNYRQLIILGSGFDHLGKYFANKGLKCFEMDVPRMANLKLNFLEKYAYDNHDLTVLPVRLSNSSLLNYLIQTPGLDSANKTIIVAEGFFDYLTPAEVEAILKDLSRYFENKVTLISTLFALDELSRFNSIIFKAAVSAVGEKLKLYSSKKEFVDILKSHGFQVENLINGKTMRKKILTPNGIRMPVLPGFYLVKVLKELKTK